MQRAGTGLVGRKAAPQQGWRVWSEPAGAPFLQDSGPLLPGDILREDTGVWEAPGRLGEASM